MRLDLSSLREITRTGVRLLRALTHSTVGAQETPRLEEIADTLPVSSPGARAPCGATRQSAAPPPGSRTSNRRNFPRNPVTLPAHLPSDVRCSHQRLPAVVNAPSSSKTRRLT